MFALLSRKLFGSHNERMVRRLQSKVDAIGQLEAQMQALSDEELRALTPGFRARLDKGEALDALLPEAFAAVREAARRVLGLRHYDVQLIGGMVLHQGRIAEMRTGEGKTLVATAAVYLNALPGKGVHVVTVNDYLARRDAEWMSRVYGALGMTTGIVVHGLDDDQRRASYAADITYGTNNEFGFDYLRDNMKFRERDMVQRGHHFAIVDEVDSILIDEARTPLIISGPAQDSSQLYIAVDRAIPHLPADGYEVDEKHRTATFSESGTEALETWLAENGMLKEGSLYDLANIALVHHANQALRAHKLFTRDKDYIVKDGKVIIIDEFTGRMMEGRRYSEGLHQALEAKERVEIQRENQTLASITFQNYFRMYDKLAGMTGTALTEAAEFGEIYKLEVVDIPTNRPVQRVDHPDEIYRNEAEKFAALIDEIGAARERNQPVLVGTVSIEKSERLSRELDRRKIPHKVLNARHHEQEAHIVAQAGVPGAVTIATNMAGRGTDIQLGGNIDMLLQQMEAATEDPAEVERRRAEIEAEVARGKQIGLEAGGLFVIGTERHESRRIDNQLRGRSGRQGDPGASKFFLSLEDDLMRIFATDKIKPILEGLGMKEGEKIASPLVSRVLEKAQRKVEAHHFDIRKNLLKYDNVMNDQRKVIYDQRRSIMTSEDISELVQEMRMEVVQELVSACIPPGTYADHWDVDRLEAETERQLGLSLPVREWAKEEGIAEIEIQERLQRALDEKMAAKTEAAGVPAIRSIEKGLVLQLLDQLWKDHLQALDYMRQGINLRAYAQRDPLNEYKSEAFQMFHAMLGALRQQTVTLLANIQITPQSAEPPPPPPQEMVASHPDPHVGNDFSPGADPAAFAGDAEAAGIERRSAAAPAPFAYADVDPDDPATWSRTPRNAPCPCGSGRKYKQCHGTAS